MSHPDQYWRALAAAAARTNPTPNQSNYHVRGAALTSDGDIVAGSNHEYSITRAIHCEESIVSRLLDTHGPNARIEALLFITPNTETLGPCGNCRDVLRQYMLPDSLIIRTDGNVVNTKPFSNYLFENPRTMLPAERARMSRTAYKNALGEARTIYGAALQAKRGNDQFVVSAAGYRGDDAYHPSLPISNAITLALQRPRTICDIDGIVIAQQKGTPEVPYLERQHLWQFQHTHDLKPIPVYLVGAEGTENMKITDSKEWLPFRFKL